MKSISQPHRQFSKSYCIGVDLTSYCQAASPRACLIVSHYNPPGQFGSTQRRISHTPSHIPMPSMDDKKAIVISISGCSSSGKTTLARLLRDIFPKTFILHEDDFYKTDEQIPLKDGIQDWDCAGAISLPDMESALNHIHETGTFPSFIASKEDQNSIGACPVPESVITNLKTKVSDWVSSPTGKKIFEKVSLCVLDGFLLYTPEMRGIMDRLDIKLFLLVSHEKAKARREARDGYVTLEGFWKDPPGYVDKIVWPNYVESHAWLFEEGDVEGRLRKDVLEREEINAQIGEGLDVDMSVTLKWAVDTVMQRLEEMVR